MTTQEIALLREQILQELADQEPRVYDAVVQVAVDDETAEESTAVELTLADPPKGEESWDLNRLDELAVRVERIIAEKDLPPAVVSMRPLSREDFEDDPTPAK